MTTTHHTPGGGEAPEAITPTRIIPAGQPLPDPEPGWDSEPQRPARESWSRYRDGATPLDAAPEGDRDLPPWRRLRKPRETETPGGTGAPAPRETAPETPRSHPTPPETPEVTIRLADADRETLVAIRDALAPVEQYRPTLRDRLFGLARGLAAPWRGIVPIVATVACLIPILDDGHGVLTWWHVTAGRMRDEAGLVAALIGTGFTIAVTAASAYTPDRSWRQAGLLGTAYHAVSPALLIVSVAGLFGAVELWDLVYVTTGVPR
ncbi:hypothetical protein [Streptomyces bohaiensis]|uniref:DUF2637 domain-containing protein n=2 Tax=Streptomyces bohaiensis TaxID=1431344 RepID=A0ABX1C8D1_9ACTN|nr:hypothetical protein [Streptomyces bohaiensis]NJQ14210.1 hypothetical protein [Streptomyces bohaiensis]